MTTIATNGIEVWQGDCLERMREIEHGTVDAIVTDPPYGLDIGIGKDMRAGRHGLAKAAYGTYEDSYENYCAVVVPAISMALSLARRGAVFSGPHLQELPKASAIGGIYCSAGTGRHSWGFKTFLPILFYGKDPSLNLGARPNVIESNAVAPKNGHPCPKPLAWMIWLIERTTLPGETVLDPFAGSGSTLVACMKTGRRCIGIELDEKYIPIIHRRVREAETPLFD